MVSVILISSNMWTLSSEIKNHLAASLIYSCKSRMALVVKPLAVVATKSGMGGCNSSKIH